MRGVGRAPPRRRQISNCAGGICVKDLRERLETDNKDMSYKEVRDDLLAYIERRREAQADGPMPVDTRNQEEEEYMYSAPDFQQWGGARDPCVMEEEAWADLEGVFGQEEAIHPEVAQVQASWGTGVCPCGKGRANSYGYG